MAHQNPSTSWTALLKGMHDKATGNVNVSALGQITAINGNQADVQLLAKTSDNHSHLSNCYMIETTPLLAVGDQVLVVFTDLPTEEYNGAAYDVILARRHSINDAVIIGRLM